MSKDDNFGFIVILAIVVGWLVAQMLKTLDRLSVLEAKIDDLENEKTRAGQ